jgi:acetyl esterase
MLHPQAVAALQLWAAAPSPGETGFDVAEQRRLAREAAAAEQREPVSRVDDVDADGVPCRLYVPEAATGSSAATGAILYLHGGGFVFGDLDTHDAQCRRLANRTGLAVLAVDYRRPPEHRFPAAVEDADTALAWLRSRGPSYGIDPGSLVALGDSAGGNLALVAALRNPGVLGELVLVYPFLDPGRRFPSYARNQNPALSAVESAWYWQQYAARPEDLDHPDLAPLGSERLDTLPRTLVIAAGCDVLLDEDAEIVRRIQAAGGRARLTTYDGMVHGFWRHPELFDAAEDSLAEIGRFLGR